MRAYPRSHLGRIAITLVIVGAAAGIGAEDLVTGQLEIRGAVLRVSPERQEVSPGLPTVVLTALGQLEPGQIPPGLRVEGELSGPGLDEPLRLTTTPGDVFRIPGLNREGTYTLSGIRLVEGDRTISAADPDSVEILVHRLVISSITSRALTPDEMDAYGIVIDSDNYTAWHYSVGFQIEGGTVEVPFDLMLGPQGMTLLDSPNAYSLPVPNPDFPEVPVPTVSSGALEPIPRTALDLEERDIEILASTPIPGFIIIPTDIAFLNQFFSVIMVVQNGALAGSGLELRDLTGVLELSGDGIRQAETDPPTIPGEPVPVLDPGPDGEQGTSDDLTFIVAQASGQATWLVEGLREGQHRLTAHLTGEIHGLASGEPAPIEGRIPGVVVVRDPRFALTFFHPNTVRTGEFYDFRVSVTNTSTTPVYDLSLELPPNSISGARLLEADDDDYDEIEEGDNDPVQRVAELLPGTTGMVTWRLESRRTGRVVASAFNTSSPLDASFVFEIGVGELGIPLSPETIVLPPVVDDLPTAVVEPALELLGLAHSLANAPNGVEVDLPPVGETIVMLRGTELAAAGKRHAFGEPVSRSVVGLGLEWMGASHWSSSFDVLRRQSRRGHELENGTAYYLGERMEEIGADEALDEIEELAISGRPMLLVFAEGAGFSGKARLALVGNISGRSAIGQRADVEFFSRELEGAAILGVNADSWSGEVGVIAVPLGEEEAWFEGSYQIQLWGTQTGSVNLEVVLVMPDGGTRRFVPSAAVETGSRSLAYINVGPVMDSTSIQGDTDGDSIQDLFEPIDVELRSAPPAKIITAGFVDAVNPVRGGPYRNVVLLISQPVDSDALAAIDAADWFVESELEIATAEGGSESFVRDRHGRSFRLQLDPRILIATFEEPLNPHAELRLSNGPSLLPLVGGGALAIIDQPITAGAGLESGVVRGVVLGPDGGPLAHSIVEIYERLEICHAIQGCNWYPSLSDRVTTDAAGGFLFDAVRYRDETIPSQQAAFTVRAVDPSTGHETRLVARLPGGNQIRSLTLAMVGRGDVVGTLRKVDGSPLVDPMVIARSITNPSEGAQAAPDASGNFRLEDLPVGPVQVVATDGQAYTFATAQITAPGAEATVDLVLQEFSQPLAQVEGSVIDGETAEPVPGLDVYVIPAGFSGPTHVATTDGEGGFSMADVPPGVARFKAWSPNLGRYVGEVVSDLLGDSTNGVEMVLRPGATGAIVGTVTLAAVGSEEPVVGAYVVARDQGVFTLTDEDSRYELANLPLGKIRLETWDPVTAAATTRAVDLTADGQVLVIDFVLREDHGLGSVTVNVANRNGVPEVGAEVAIGWFGSSYGGRTGEDGKVWIEEVPPGTHDVLVRQGGRLARGMVSVLYPGHAAETSVILGGLRNATITVVGDTTGDGSSVPLTPIGYRVPGVQSNGAIGQLPEDGWTDCELEDDHSCRVENLPTDVGSLVAVASSGFYGPVTASKWIDDGGDHELVINFEALGVVGGRIVTSGLDGVEPVEGAVVELWTRVTSGLIPQSQYTTRADGVFQFDLVPLGEYSLRAYHPSYGVQWLNGRVSAGQVIDDLELRLRGRASIEGEVALCFEKAFAKAGSQVRVSLRPYGVPRPFISDLEIEDFNDGVLDVTLGDDESASFLFANRMVGGWTLTATSALHGSAYEPVSLGPPGETATLAEPLCLHPTGSVTGQVSFPETGEPASSVTVQLFRKVSHYYEYLTTETTGEDGSYAMVDVPVGRDYQVRAFDTASNRGGVSATVRLCDASESGYGTTCGRDAVLNVSLSAMGRLEGVLRDQHELTVSGAHIRLRTSVVLNQNGTVQSYQREWTTFSAADGSFAFDGVPAGTALVTAFDPDSPLFVEESISVDPVGSPIVVADLDLPPTAEVAVRVVDPFGADVDGGDPVVVFRQSSQSKFREPSGSSPRVEHLSTGATPSFAGVVADRYDVGACFGGCSSVGVDQVLAHQFNSALGAVAQKWMSNPPTDQVVELELAGRASVAVTVTQSGAPVAEAVVRITGGGFYGTRDVSTQTGADGAIFPIEGLGIGSYTVTASWSGLGGSREFEITQADHDGSVDLTVAIEASSSAAGQVLDPEAQPAEGALIKMIFGGRTFQTVSDGDGAFVFSALPINQIFRLEAYAANGLGRHTLRNIVVGIESVDLGVLVLDEANPWVAGVTPANGAQDADTDVDVVIDFSELMRWGTMTGDRIKLREHGSGDLVPTTRTIEDQPDPDGEGQLVPFTRVTLSHGPLDSEKLYLVDVLNTVEDLAGRSPAFDFHSTYRTRDTVPPAVMGVSPTSDPDGLTPVGPDVVPIVSFSESMDPESVDEATVRLLDSDDQLQETVLDLQRDSFDIRIRPTTALELDVFYTVVVDGVTDAAGLPLPAPYTSIFRVRDIEPPAATLLPPVGVSVDGAIWRALEGRPLILRAAANSNDALKTVVFTFGGVPLAAVFDDSGEYRLDVVAPTAVNEVMVSVQAEDVSGNLSPVVSRPVVLVDDQPPAGALSLDHADGIYPNHVLAFAVTAEDDHGLREAHVTVSGAATGEWTLNLDGSIDDTGETVRVPVDAVAGTQITVSCELEDSIGQRTTVPPQTVVVAADTAQPVVSVIVPQPGAIVTSGQEMVFRFALEDEVVVESTSFEVDGEAVELSVSSVQLPGESWTAEAASTWAAPGVSESTDLEWTLIAIDQSGNSGTITGAITVSPLISPDAPVVTIICPLDGDGCAPGVGTTLNFHLFDDDEGDQIENYTLIVDGARGDPVPVNQGELTGSVEWTPPADAQAGDAFTLRLEAVDLVGNVGWAVVHLVVPSGTILVGDQALSSDYSGEHLVLNGGTFTATESLNPDSLTLLGGARLTTPNLQPLIIETAGAVSISCSASIDVTGRGYAPNETYPGGIPPNHESGAGSHLGEGGIHPNYTPGSTFGSVYRPQEGGGAGYHATNGRRGGGVVRIEAATIDLGGSAVIRANGANAASESHQPGGGGSVWITGSSITGTGIIEAKGGDYYSHYDNGLGGGGAIAIEYGSMDQAIVDGLSTTSRDGDVWWEPGGAGTVYLYGPSSTYGDLEVANDSLSTPRWTILPSLGVGVAQAGSTGVTLVTDRSEAIPGYFAGHWVEVRQPDETLKGTWRIESVDNLTATLEAGADVAEGDLWQGVYRFDSVMVADSGKLWSDDPIRTPDLTLSNGGQLIVAEQIEAATVVLGGGANWSTMWSPVVATGSVEVAGPVSARRIEAPALRVRAGGTLSHPSGGSESLEVDVTDLVVEDGASIDVTGRGYAPNETYPGGIPPNHESGAGSHLGEGGIHPNYTPGSTFGSVYRPQEGGGAGYHATNGRRGGGVVRIEAATIDLGGSAVIRANGANAASESHQPGGGGSVWITGSSITGAGIIEAKGGDYYSHYDNGLGGGGAIAIEYGSMDQAIVDGLSTTSRDGDVWWEPGGAGTVYLYGPSSTYGDLEVANDSLSTPRWTILPSLGVGVAQAGSTGVTLVTDRSEAIPGYFAGHWVEVRQPDETLKGTWRIESVDNLTATLEAGADVAEGDLWQGVYRFDSVMVADSGKLWSDDPIRTPDLTLNNGGQLNVAESIEAATVVLGGGASWSTMWSPVVATGSVEVAGPVSARGIEAPILTVRAGGKLSHPAGGSERLALEVTDLVVEDGGSIDVTGRGYGPNETYPGAIPPNHESGAGSHLGEGGIHPNYTPGSTFGSVYRPQEGGGGGNHASFGMRGGGVVRIEASTIDLGGSAAIRANGANAASDAHQPGAGGSVWITGSSITGTGFIEAKGGDYYSHYDNGLGGGGAIAIEYGSIDQAIVDGLSATSRDGDVWWEPGGAGTVYLYGPSSTYGDLEVANDSLSTPRWTILPSLGGGEAQAGSTGVTLVTDRSEAIPGYFAGHWVEVRQPDETLKGTWRVESVDNLTLTLEAGADVAEGDLWQGVYRFDRVVVRDMARLRVGDLDEFGFVDVEPGAVLETINHEPPAIDLEKISLFAYGGAFRIAGVAGAVSDVDGIASARAVNVTGGGSTALNVGSDGSFSGVVEGAVGDTVVLEVEDNHRNPRSSSVELGVLPANNDVPAIDPSRIQFVARPNPLGHLDSYLDGDLGAVLDVDQPVLVTATNLVTGFFRETTATASGDFSMTVRGTVGDSYELTVTDGHPAVNTAVLDLGPLPDLFEPNVYPEKITVTVGDRLFWLSSREPAFWDDGEFSEAYAFNITQPEVTYPLEILPDGILAPSPIPSQGGVILQVVVVDGVGNQQTALLDPLPANDGPPILRPEYVSGTTATGRLLIENSGWCIWEKSWNAKSVSCSLPIGSYDGIENIRFENRTTPGFGPFEFAVIEECPNCYTFDPVEVDGAVGDAIWLVIEDDHPEWQATEAFVWTLPQIPGAPEISLEDFQLGWVEGEPLLAIFENDITDPDEPLTLETVAWREVGDTWVQVHTDSRSVASGEALDVPLSGGEQGDLVVASVTDSTGLKTTVRVGHLPPPEPVEVRLQQDFITAPEYEPVIAIHADLGGVPLTPVTVGWRTVSGTAVAGVDFVHDEGVLTFPRGTRDDERIEIEILNDSDPEDDETFRVELFNPVGAELGYPRDTEITIFDDDEIIVVPFSVAVGALNFLDGPVDVSVVNGVAHFAQPLPAVVGRGDRLEIEGLGSVFIDRCGDDSTCTVVDGLGLAPMDAYGVPVTIATAAFQSLAEALTGASDADHLGTFDLVAAYRVLELVCYGGYEDTTPVVIDNWVTSRFNRIRIVAADVSYGHDVNWRHPGRWSGSAYRVEVDGTDCISTTVGNLTIEGLQLGCGAGPDVGVAAIRVGETAGSLEVAETLIMLDGTAGAGQRAGIAISSGEALEVEVRNSILWDLGDPGNEFQAGILVDGPQISLWAANNTIVGGGYGIHNIGGTVTAINNLVAGSGLASYEGDFELESTLNLGSDATTPDPPANAIGPVTVSNPVPSHNADFHLRCGVLDQPVTISHDLEVGSEEELSAVFDGNPDTLLRSASINPARVRLDFGGVRAVTGTSVVVSHHDSHEWMVAAADSVADLEAQTGSYREIVSWRALENTHIIWDGVTFDTPESFQVIELAVQRIGGDDYVHINDWSLESLNPACGQGADLSVAGEHAFVRDVDSAAREGAWDIGADQNREFTVGFAQGPHDWWEDERTARIQVVLSEPALATVTVRYRTESLSAVPVEDYDEETGMLVFDPGEFSKIIRIHLNNDGPTGDEGESFAVVLFDAVGARLTDDWWEIWLREGPPPARVRLMEELIEVNEADGVARVEVNLSDEQESDVWGTWDASDGSAHIGADYRGAPWASFNIPNPEDYGYFEFELVDDDVAEGVEGFLITGGDANGAMLGVPSVGYVRIIDDDGGSP